MRTAFSPTHFNNAIFNTSPNGGTIFSSEPEILESDGCFRSRSQVIDVAVELSSVVGRQPVIFMSLFRIVLKVGLRSQGYI